MERVGDEFDLDEFVFAMKANFTVKHVCFSGTFVRKLDEEQWKIMLGSVGFLEALEELQVWCSTVPVAVFRETILHAQNLRKVYFFRVSLAGSQEEFDQFAEAIKGHPNLRDVRMGGFEAVTNNGTISLNALVEGMAVMPALEILSLKLSNFRALAPFSAQSLSKVFQSKTIRDLYLSHLGLRHDHLAVVAAGVQHSTTIRLLDLFGNDVYNSNVIQISKALENNTALETLVLPCPTENLSTESCAAISKAIQQNKHLQTLHFPRSNFGDDGLLHISQGLTVNTTLKTIEVGVSKEVSSQGTEALLSMLDKNYKLEKFVVSSAEKDVKDKVEYYTRLNEVGRGSLLQQTGKATRAQWVDMLISVNDDLDCLYYFMLMNPSACQVRQTSEADVIATEEFKPIRRHTITLVNEDSTDHAIVHRASVLQNLPF